MPRFILSCGLVLAVLSLLVPAAVEAQNAKATFVITNQGVDVENKAWFGVYRLGEHDSYIDYAYSGKSLEVPAGTYDIGIFLEDDAVKHQKWLTGQALKGEVRQTVELGIETANVKFTVTNNGTDVGNKAWWGVYHPGKHDSYISYKYSGETMIIQAGTYDIGIEFNDGSAKVQKWLPGEKLENKVEKTVELGQPLAQVTYTVTNNGTDVGNKAWWGVYRPGKHDSYISYKYSGETMTIPAGTYDIGIEFNDGSAKTVKWLENEKLEGQTTKSVELGMALAKVKITVTNHGQDVGKKAWWGVYEPGERGNYYAYEYSGSTLTLPQGDYDLGVHFSDGEVRLERWDPGLKIKGDVEKTIELVAGIADLTVHVSRRGRPLDGAWCGVYRTKKSEAYQGYAYSDKSIRVEEGVYDIGCFYAEKGVSTAKWIERKELKGKVELNVELDLQPASLTVLSPDQEKTPGREDRPAGSASAGAAATNIALIIDSSGSMAAKVEDNKTRLEVAKEVLSGVIDSLPKSGVQVGLYVYGTEPKSKVDCKDTKVLYPLGAVNAAALKQAVNGLRPGGYTPIAYALERAGAGLPPGCNNSLVLVTDGIESCKGDPCAVSARLASQGIVTRSFVVGFGLGLDKGQFLSCIGRYYPVSDRAGLTQALREVMEQSLKPVSGRVTIYRAGDRKEVVAQGALNEKLILPAGTYDVLLRVGEKNISWAGVKIDGDLTSPVGEQPALR